MLSFSGIDSRFSDRFGNRPVKAVAKSSREWAGELARDRNPFVFSARCSDAKLLGAMKAYILRDLQGNPAHGRSRFISDMRKIQGVPLSGEAGSGKLTDLKSSRRLKLIYDFHKRRVQEEAYQAAVNNDDHRVVFPYRELYRPASSNPRFPRNWGARARSMGFSIVNGRIFAPRDSVLWRRINRFGFDHAPWDYNSGMDSRFISRAEAKKLGLPLVSFDEALENPRAVTPEQAKAERERKRYYAAEPAPQTDAQRSALAELENPSPRPFTVADAQTLPLEAYIDPDTFENRDAQKAYLDRKWEAASKAGTPKNLSPQQTRAVKRYTDNSSEINKALRSGETESPEVKQLISAFDGQRFQMNVNVVRTADLIDLEKNLGVRPGHIDEDLTTLRESGRDRVFPGVTSTSLFSRFHPEGIRAKDELQVEYRIRIPHGANAMFLDPISTKGPYGLSGSANATKAPPRLWSRDGKNAETEIAIAPGSKFAVDRHEIRTENGLKKLIVWLILRVK